MKPKDHDEQLRQFFQHSMDNPLYLKKYVREHPANKMAWYLLGREYEAQGKKGKALYCYTQAGEIYEAFENQTIQVSPESEQSLRQWERQGKRNQRRQRGRLAAIGLLLLAGVLYAPEFHDPHLPKAESRITELPDGVTPAQVQETKVYYIAGPKSKENAAAALQEMLLKERVNSYAILAHGQSMGDARWISWLRSPDILLSVEGKQDAALQQIQYHDAESCSCQPTEASKPKAIYGAWAAQREQELVLRSALAAYEAKHGKPPESLRKLNEPYPGNMLPGVTPYMEQLYEELAGSPEKAGLPETSAPASNPASAPGAAPASADQPSVSTGGLIKPLTEPLRIVVDKQNHRLAVVSGQVIVRNYPVGLGAERTPEGTFQISEKVRNPNGKSNGEFGSRGMTLSDTLYAIHGTNQPASIEKDKSLGCIRMLKEDVEELFDMVPMGTSVTIGKRLLPVDIQRSEPVFRLPASTEETNPGKVYKWLN
ncbi:L,D-transpeptidase [Paenibacillus sp. H1-7]|uniref:L,D-transpeptidase family protein n=1 Tax=Paenibacillus sp. H1-7 TaxID=2282849 RepID=UPI001EF8B6C6|nr:L,D-transpeptidase family protein [Paenibacillus sp. H1-7]ULL19694.1 L,D-transpeptidase [Paenibacillus sp. H1-7]